MKVQERVFAIEDGSFEDAISNVKFKEDNAGKQATLLVKGRNRDIVGIMSTPNDEDEVNELIEALKMYKLRFRK